MCDFQFLGQRSRRVLSPKGRVTLHCKSIPGADHLANVASESPIADQRAQVGWDIVFEFDGEIRNAAFGIECAVGEDALSGAGGDAARACATMISDHRKVWFESQVKQDLGKQKVGALFWINETGVFADPPDAGALGEITFKDGTGIGVIAVPDRTSSLLLDKLNEFLHARGQNVMIVRTPGIGGNARFALTLPALRWRGIRCSENQNGFALRKN